MSLERSDLSAELPADELAQAVKACRKQDRRLDMYYKFASPTARRFVELGFYSNFFGERTDPDLYVRCRDAIAPTLSESDLLYLLRFESDPDTKAYLNDLLAQLRAPKPAPPRPRFPAKRKKSRPKVAHRWSVGRNPTNSTFGLKALALLAGVCLIVVIGAVRAYVNNARDEEAARQQAAMRDDFTPLPTEQQSKRPQKHFVRTYVRPAETVVSGPVEASAEEPAPTVAEVEQPAKTNDVTTVAEVRKKTPKVVFTDDIRIRTRPDGTVEVPRTFSYAGAGLKRPFWIYDPQLEKSGRIEHEARAEKAARAKWKALWDEARRQEATASSRGSCP